MIILKLISILYVEVCTALCTIELISRGLTKVDKYIDKRKRVKQKVVEDEIIFNADDFIFETDDFKKSVIEFMENSNKFHEECRELLARNDKHMKKVQI